MSAKMLDYSIFDKFKFERKPVGVKYSLAKPKGIKPLDKSLALCEMFKEAQTSPPPSTPPEKTSSVANTSSVCWTSPP
jgi:hypothetical protein